MSGVVSDFANVTCTLIDASNGDYDSDGLWDDGEIVETTFKAAVQPMNEKEIESLEFSSQRVIGSIKIYPEFYQYFQLSPYMRIKVDLGSGMREYRIVKTDLRPWNSYAKIICNLLDE